MAALNARGSGRRRTVNEINMVPFIDVMLVLLIIFMVSAPLMTPGVIDVPTVGQAQRQPDRIIEVIVDKSELLSIKVGARNGDKSGATGDGERVALRNLAERVKLAQNGDAQAPVIISADKGVNYEAVVKVMDSLQRAGVARVGLSVRTTGS